MATTSLKLSKIADPSGKCQVIVRLTISRTNRPSFKSGVFIRPEWLQIIETTRGQTYEIRIPNKGKLNRPEVREAERAEADLKSFMARLATINNALEGGHELVTHDSIEEALRLLVNVSTTEITYGMIKDARREHEQRQHDIDTAKSFADWLNLYLEKKELSAGRKRGFKVLCRMLLRYEHFIRATDRKRKGFTLDIHTIDKDTIEDFFDYARNEKELSEEYPEIFKVLLTEYPSELSPKHKTNAIEERGRNLLVTRKKALRAFFNWLRENKYTSNRPFEDIKIESEVYGTPYFLTLEERNTIADATFSSPQLKAQADIFVFQCLVGCRVSDLMRLRPEDIKGDVLEYVPHKTRDKKPIVVSVPLNDRAKELIEKYKGVDKKGRLFPFINNQRYNEVIKAILTECGITRKVTVIDSITGESEQRPINEIASSHMARRTFIGNLYRQVKDPNLIGSLSGHAEGSRAFARYRAIDFDLKKEVVNLIN